jgi:hypothetical protein
MNCRFGIMMIHPCNGLRFHPVRSRVVRFLYSSKADRVHSSNDWSISSDLVSITKILS